MRYTLILWLFYLNSCQSTKPNFISQPKVILPMSSWESDQLGVSVAIFDCQLEKWYVYNSLLLNESYSPASTFKIPNSLIALQTAILHSPEEKWVWDGIVRQNENWNKDQSLKDAFRNYTLWFYQRLAKKIGKERMSEYLRKFTYGNQQVGDSIDQFWLNGILKISPIEQLEFLYKLHKKTLGLKSKVYNDMKDIMFTKSISDVKIYAKTGWGYDQKQDIGWYVGYAEKGKKTFLFTTILLTQDYQKVENFALKRIEITENALRLAGVIP